MPTIIPIPAFADNYIWLVCERQQREQLKRKPTEPKPPSLIAQEHSTNPFLSTDDPAVCAAAERHAGRLLPDRGAVFAEVRAWKNAS